MKTAATTTMMMMAHRHDLQQARRRHHVRELQGDEHDRELERQPEDRHHQQDEAEIRDGVVDGLKVGPADRFEPAEGVREDDVGRGRSERNSAKDAEHERDGVAALRRLEPGRHEAPDLEEDDGRRQHQAPEKGDLHAQRQPVERRGDEEVAGAVGGHDERVVRRPSGGPSTRPRCTAGAARSAGSVRRAKTAIVAAIAKAITQMITRRRSSPRCSPSVMLSGVGFCFRLAVKGSVTMAASVQRGVGRDRDLGRLRGDGGPAVRRRSRGLFRAAVGVH